MEDTDDFEEEITTVDNHDHFEPRRNETDTFETRQHESDTFEKVQNESDTLEKIQNESDTFETRQIESDTFESRQNETDTFESRRDEGPQRSQTMPNIASASAFVDVHPILIETEFNSSPKILNSVFEDREPEKNDKNDKNRKNGNRIFHKNSTSVASAVNAYSKLKLNYYKI
jgi:hypothetical protein